MQEVVTEFLKSANMVQLIAMAVMFWFFYNRLDSKIEKLDQKIDKFDQKLEKKVDDLEKKIDALAVKVEDVDRRLCRIEGSLSPHGHYIYRQHPQNKRAG